MLIDITRGNGFSLVELTDRVNRMPYVPSRLGQLIDWNEQGISTLGVIIEEYQGELKLINPQPRGAPGETVSKPNRKLRDLRVPHYPIPDFVAADEVIGVRAFGSETELETLMGKIDMRMQEHLNLRFNPTLEYQRIGAVKGIILNGDGSTLYNLFTEFNVTQPAEIAFDLSNAASKLRTNCTAVSRLIQAELGGMPLTGIYALVGDTFWDQLLDHPEYRAAYLNQPEAKQLREGAAYQSTYFGGITFENYRGVINGNAFIAADKAQFFAQGVPGLFRTVFVPADLIETVGTVGRQIYSYMYPMANGKGMHFDMQMNAISYCTRPKSLVQGRRQA
jgi:hypothetical protein